ncbi:hypothetical protein [Streptomyces sp. DSM 41634]|uniref:hypothetical protein n=1 Tax=Streptomyces sp. DSM 41634 TaxID=3448656 RepID=UPI002884E69E|nr:hypothetical protein [Streptomyces sp. DSM 41633]
MTDVPQSAVPDEAEQLARWCQLLPELEDAAAAGGWLGELRAQAAIVAAGGPASDAFRTLGFNRDPPRRRFPRPAPAGGPHRGLPMPDRPLWPVGGQNGGRPGAGLPDIRDQADAEDRGMTAFLTGLGGKIAERWLSLLLLLALLYGAAVLCAAWLPYENGLDKGLLADHAKDYLKTCNGRPYAVAVLVVLVLLAVAGLGVLARFAAILVGRACLGPWPRPLAPLTPRLTERRRRRVPNGLERYRPACPTAAADRVRLIDERLDAEYGLRAALLWPRLWLPLSPDVRAPIQASAQAYTAATALAGWGLLYLALGPFWWPSLLIGAAEYATAAVRLRSAIDVFAELVESAVDTHQPAPAAAFSLTLANGSITPAQGADVTDRLNKGA